MLKIKINRSGFQSLKKLLLPTTFFPNATNLNCWSRCCFNMRLYCECDLIIRTSRGSLFHFWMLPFCNDQLLDLRRISCSVLLFSFTNTLPFREKISAPSDFSNEISFLSFESLIWLVKSSAGRMTYVTKRSLDLKFFLIYQPLIPQLICWLIRCFAEKFRFWKNRALKVKWERTRDLNSINPAFRGIW